MSTSTSTNNTGRKYLDIIKGKSQYYNDIVILLETGMRVSELYGLTLKDVDFDKYCVHVQRQLVGTAAKPYFISSTKSGVRVIPMSLLACKAFKDVIQNRKHPKVEMMIDGVGGFVLFGQKRSAEGCYAYRKPYAHIAGQY